MLFGGGFGGGGGSGSTASGALSGAASGAATGAMFGPWGAVIGGAAGLAGGLLSSSGGGGGLGYSASRAQNNNSFGRDFSAGGDMANQFTNFANGLDLGGYTPFATYTQGAGEGGEERMRALLGGQEYQRLMGLNEVMRQEKNLQGISDSWMPRLMAEFDANSFNSADGQARNNDILGMFDTGSNEAARYIRGGIGNADADVAAINATSDQQVTRRSRELAASLKARGLSGSSQLEADVATNILPETEAGRLSAIAQARNAANNRSIQGGQALGQLTSSRGNFAQGQNEDYMDRRYNPQMQAQMLQHMLQLQSAPGSYRAQVLGQPGAIYSNVGTKDQFMGGGGGGGAGASGGGVNSNLGGMLGTIGGDILGQVDWSRIFG